MKGFNLPPLSRHVSPWVCRSCTQQAGGQRGALKRSLKYSTKVPGNNASRRNRRVILAAAGGSLGIGALAFTDDIKHTYKAAERTGRVVSTLALCINEYANYC